MLAGFLVIVAEQVKNEMGEVLRVLVDFVPRPVRLIDVFFVQGTSSPVTRQYCSPLVPDFLWNSR